ncbi:MAG: hypothetical protein ACR2RL_02805 [Gammaproteobacteria bacterium]
MIQLSNHRGHDAGNHGTRGHRSLVPGKGSACKLLVVLAASLLGLASPIPADAARFAVTGTAIVDIDPGPAVELGESVTLRFSYDLPDFLDATLLAGGSIARYDARTPIELRVVGSESGLLQDVGPIRSLSVFDNGSAGDVWRFSSGTETSRAATLTSFNRAATEFEGPLPSTSAEAHEVFFPRHELGDVWVDASSGILLTGEEERLSLLAPQWSIQKVPLPSALLLFSSASGFILLLVRRRRVRS